MKSPCMGVNNREAARGAHTMDHRQAIGAFAPIVETVGLRPAAESPQMLNAMASGSLAAAEVHGR